MISGEGARDVICHPGVTEAELRVRTASADWRSAPPKEARPTRVLTAGGKRESAGAQATPDSKRRLPGAGLSPARPQPRLRPHTHTHIPRQRPRSA